MSTIKNDAPIHWRPPVSAINADPRIASVLKLRNKYSPYRYDEMNDVTVTSDLYVATEVASTVVCVSVCVCFAHGSSVLKRLNLSKCRLFGRLVCWAQWVLAYIILGGVQIVWREGTLLRGISTGPLQREYAWVHAALFACRRWRMCLPTHGVQIYSRGVTRRRAAFCQIKLTLWTLPAWVQRSVASVCLSVCLSVCPRSKKKTAWTINTKLCTRIFYSSRSACIDPEVKRSKVKVTLLRKPSRSYGR